MHTGARHDLALERIAVQINDPRQHIQARRVNDLTAIERTACLRNQATFNNEIRLAKAFG
jgi:hypothetical protein